MINYSMKHMNTISGTVNSQLYACYNHSVYIYILLFFMYLFTYIFINVV